MGKELADRQVTLPAPSLEHRAIYPGVTLIDPLRYPKLFGLSQGRSSGRAFEGLLTPAASAVLAWPAPVSVGRGRSARSASRRFGRCWKAGAGSYDLQSYLLTAAERLLDLGEQLLEGFAGVADEIGVLRRPDEDAALGIFRSVSRVDADPGESWHVHQQRQVALEPLARGDDHAVGAGRDGSTAGDLPRLDDTAILPDDILKAIALELAINGQLADRAVRAAPGPLDLESHEPIGSP